MFKNNQWIRWCVFQMHISIEDRFRTITIILCTRWDSCLIIHVHLLHQPFLSQSHSNPAFYNLHTVLSESRLSQYLMQFITCHYIYIYIIIIFPIYIANFEVYFIFKQLSCGWETLSISLSSSLAPHLKIVLTVTMDTQNAKPLPPNQQTHKSIPFWYA